MESLKNYSLNLTEEAYHAYPAWSYSIIAKYAKGGFSSLSTLHDPVTPTPSMEFGSLFDSVMTRGKATLDEYTVVDVTVPDAERKALDYIASRTDKPHAKIDEINVDDLIRYCDECKYQPKWGYEARLKHLKPYSKYYDALRTGKKPVSQEDWNDAIDMCRVFRNDEYLKTIFGTKNCGDVEYYYQLQFCENIQLDSGRTVDVKIMPDLLVVNHKDKTVQPVDLKTSSSPAYEFTDNFLKFRYDIQAILYSDILGNVLGKIPDYMDYTILPYLFTDISRTDKVPVTYVYDQTDESQKNGFSFSKDGKTYTYKHWMSLLDEILEYEEAKAKVPSFISLVEANNLLDILSR